MARMPNCDSDYQLDATGDDLATIHTRVRLRESGTPDGLLGQSNRIKGVVSCALSNPYTLRISKGSLFYWDDIYAKLLPILRRHSSQD